MLFILSSISAFAQTPQEIKENADKMFDEGLYVEAYDLYNSITGTFSREHDWNFKYGACVLYAEHDKSKAIDRLVYSASNPSIDKRAYYFLGRAYHLNYQFKSAEKYYNKFKNEASSGQLKKFDVESQLNGCRFGRKLLSNVTDMIVMEKREIGEDAFYDLYDMSEIGGKILVTDRFGTKYDKKEGHRSVIHFPANSPNVFYSSYGENGSTGLDIYQKKKLPDGSYSLPQKVRGQVNSDKDDAYAYMHPNGKYLYFCSKGHNSMGGYDVFRSEYDEKKDAFGPPENLDFAISSPDDDIMYVVDKDDKIAYFASARESKDSKLFVYSVRVERLQMQIAAIKGKFVNTVVPGNKEVTIEIEDFSSGTQIGTYNSKTTNGDYFITFPKGGKYKYFVTIKGSDVTHYAVVDVPLLKELRPLKQQISLMRDESGEKYVKIENKFDEQFDDPITVMAEIYQELSKLQVNIDEFDLDSLDDMRATDLIFVENGLNQFSTQDDVEQTVKDKIEDLEMDLKEDEDNANIAFNLANDKSDEANEKMIELNKVLDEANNSDDPKLKNELFEKALDLKNDVEKLNDDAKKLIELGTDLTLSAKNKKLDVNDGNEVLEKIKVVSDGDKKALAREVENNTDFFTEHVKDRTPKPDLLEEIISAGNNNTKAANKLNVEIIELQEDKKTIIKNKKILEDKLANTKKKKDQEVIEGQLLEVESQLSDIEGDIAAKQKTYDVIIAGDSKDKPNLIGVANEVGDDKYDGSPYANELTDEEKTQIRTKVNENDLSKNLDEANKTLIANGAGNKVNLFASDKKRDNYTIEQWKEEIDREIRDLRDDLNTASVDRKERILEEIKEFEDLKDQKEKDFGTEVFNPEDIVAEVDKDEIIPDFQKKKDDINEMTDEEDKTMANLKLNQEFKDEILDEKKKLNDLAVKYPDNDDIKKRRENLEEIEDEVDEEIRNDENWIAANTNGIKDPEDIVAELDNDYQDKVNEIYKIEDDGQRKAAMEKLNGEIVETANERIQDLTAIIESDPDNDGAKKELEELIEFKDDLEANLDKPLVDPVVIDPNNISIKVEEEQLIEDYANKLNEINEIEDNFEKRKNQNELYEELQNETRNEIKQLTQLVDDNPGNKDITKRLTNLKKLDDDLNGKILENEEWLEDNPRTATTSELAEVKDINPNYENRMEEINEIPDDKDKVKAIEELNDETVEAIDNRMNIIDQELKDDPNNPNYRELEDEKAKLNNLKTQIQYNPKDPIIKGEEITVEIETSPSVDDILPNYQSQMAAINESGDEELDKEQGKIDLNNKLVLKIDQELNRLDKLKQDKPGLADDIEKRENALRSIKGIKGGDIVASQKIVDDLAGVVEALNPDDYKLDEDISVEDIYPEYDTELADIDNSSDTELDMEKSKINLNNRLINKIDKQLKELNELKASNPELSDKIDKRIEDLGGMKDATTEKISVSQKIVNDLGGVVDAVEINEIVTINDIDPGYETDMAAINDSFGTELEKEEDKVTLNKRFISRIDEEIDRLNDLKGERPDLGSKIDNRISGLENMKTQKGQELADGENRVKELNELAGGNDTITTPEINPADVDETATIEQVIPNYADELDNIDLALQDDITKEENKIALNKKLINKIDKEISDLRQLKESKPEVSDKVDNRIESLNQIKSETKDKVAVSQAIVDKATGDRPEITIASLMLSYEPDMVEIKGSAAITEKDKLEGENALNKSLIAAIDNKIDELQEELEDNPVQGDAISTEIEKLEELKESKRNEIANNNDMLARMGGTSDTANNKTPVDELAPEDFNTEAGQEFMEDNQEELNEIKELKGEIAGLEEDLSNAPDDKTKAKIEAQINKRKLKLAKVENQVLDGLGDVNQAEYKNEKDESEIDAKTATANNPEDPDIIDANQKLDDAANLISEAQDLRGQAAGEKDPVVKNDLLTQANDKEQEAKNKTQQSTRIFKTARVIDNFTKDQAEVIIEVPENPEDRKSTVLNKQADNLDIEANEYKDRGAFLRDSASTVKKKYKAAVLVDADAADKKVENLRTEAAKIREKAKDVETQEDEILAVKMDDSDNNPDEETIQDIATNNDYKDFVDANNSAEDNIDKANEVEEQIQNIKTQQKRKIKAAVVSYTDGGSLESAIASDEDIQSDQEKIDSLRALQRNFKDKALRDKAEANNILDKNSDIKDDMIAMSNNNVNPRDKVIPQPQDSLSADFEAPLELITDIFRTTDNSIYDDNKQIPMDQKTNGLVYKVQVGAFRKALPANHYKDFAPVSGQKLGNGITRYMAGYFTKETSANSARGDIRGAGYGDAFVVAYCNGEKISISEARKIERGEIECVGTIKPETFTNNGTDNGADNGTNNGTNNGTDNGTNNGTDNGTNNGTNNGTDNGTNNGTDNGTNNGTNNGNANGTNGGGTVVKPNNASEEELVSYYTNFPTAAEATQVEIVKGLFYTVQIGVYTKPVKPEVLFNIQPLNSQKMDNGNIRYSTGKYTALESANVRKAEVVGTGVADAFVTAYFDGERITISEAFNILSQQGPDAFYDSPANKDANFAGENDQVVTPVDTLGVTPPDTNDDGSGLLADQNETDLGPPYRVNLGYFEGEVPVSFTDLLLNNQNEGILSVSDIKDNVLYFVGTYESKEEADSKMSELASKGFSNPEIVSLKKDENIIDDVVYHPEGVHFKILMGAYDDEIPGEYATVILQTEDLLETEQNIEGTTYLTSTKIDNFDEIQDRLTEFSELGFEKMQIVAYYQYDAIPLMQAEKIVNGEPIGKLTIYENPEGVDADPYLYNKEAVYFRVDVGRFLAEVPGDFTELLFNNADENINKEETPDNEVLFFTENTYSYDEVLEIKERLISKGFVNAEVSAFHKYDQISTDKALLILGIE
jgi:DNA repair exonuclease SbcCD ATPase subunit